jgi:hypothetical protein
MSQYNFKHRNFFDFNPHPFDIGNAIGRWKGHEDNHFILKLLKLQGEQYPSYYQHHADHFVIEGKGNPERFFKTVWDLIQNNIDTLKRKDLYSSDHPNDVFKINKLNFFHEFMASIDEWNARPASMINAEMERTIVTQREHIKKLEDRLAVLNEFETVQQIRIDEGYLPTLIDLFLKFKDLKINETRDFVKCDHKSPYYKMISKYFTDGGDPIKIETVKNYFTPIAGTDKMKTEVPKEMQLFNIVPNDGLVKKDNKKN